MSTAEEQTAAVVGEAVNADVKMEEAAESVEPGAAAATAAATEPADVAMDGAEATEAAAADVKSEEAKPEDGAAETESAASKTEDAEATEVKTEETKTEDKAVKTESAAPKTEDATTAEVKTEEKKAGDTGRKPNLRSRGSKFDATQLPESSDPTEMREQVEFYFSDSNLPFDKFLFGKVTKENKPVPLAMIHSFARMRRFKPYETLVEALKSSTELELEGEPGKETVRRKVPLNLEAKKKGPRTDPDGKPITDPSVNRSIYAKGFGEETATSQVDIENFFKPYGPVRAVRLRREDENKKFKGSVFVEFASEELQAKFMALEEKPKWNDSELEWKTKGGYMDEKLQLIREGKMQPKQKYGGKKFNAFREERGGEDKHKKGDRGDKKGGRGGRGGSRGGQRGRGRGGRGGKGGRDGDRNAEKKIAEKKNGIPTVVDTSAEKAAEAAPAAAAAPAEKPVENGSKRKAEDAGPGDGGEAKKVKATAEA